MSCLPSMRGCLQGSLIDGRRWTHPDTVAGGQRTAPRRTCALPCRVPCRWPTSCRILPILHLRRRATSGDDRTADQSLPTVGTLFRMRVASLGTERLPVKGYRFRHGRLADGRHDTEQGLWPCWGDTGRRISPLAYEGWGHATADAGYIRRGATSGTSASFCLPPHGHDGPDTETSPPCHPRRRDGNF